MEAFSITIDQIENGLRVHRHWVDPASCAVTAATAGSTYNSSGLGSNSAGNPDWVCPDVSLRDGGVIMGYALVSQGTASSGNPGVRAGHRRGEPADRWIIANGSTSGNTITCTGTGWTLAIAARAGIRVVRHLVQGQLRRVRDRADGR